MRVMVYMMLFAGFTSTARAQYDDSERSCLIGVYQEFVQSSEAHSRALREVLRNAAPHLHDQIDLAIPLNEKGEIPGARMHLIEFGYLLENEPALIDFSKPISGWLPRQTGLESYIVHLKQSNPAYKRFAVQDSEYGTQVRNLFSQGAEVIALFEPKAVTKGELRLRDELVKRKEALGEMGRACLSK